MSTDHRRILEDIFQAALRSVDPYGLVKVQALPVMAPLRERLCRRLLVISLGKAAYPMAAAAAHIAADVPVQGIVITKYGHTGPVPLPETFRVFEAGHPVPDEAGVEATREAIRMIRQLAGNDTLVLCLISGGGSALFLAPCDGVSLEEKQETTRLLLLNGAEIQELNAVRKHLSLVKGGRLAEIARPAKVVSLILSDVIGDPLDVIASGPTSPDRSTFGEALAVIDKYGLRSRMPRKALDVLQMGARGEIPDTPKPGDPLFRNVENRIIGSNRIAVGAAKHKAEELGFPAEVLTTELRGEAREAGRWLAGKAVEGLGTAGRKCLIAGGETTVTVRGNGLGGRSTELALAFAGAVRAMGGITLLSAGTDGTDGPTDAAGAIVDGETVPRAEKLGLDPDAYLGDNDSYNFFKKTGGLLVTGPTGTNVMDIVAALIEPPPR
jgi:glycerate-2-kinase